MGERHRVGPQAGRPADDVGRAALAGGAEVRTLIARAGEMLGYGIAILCDVLNPELVVCGTMVVRLGDLLLEPARQGSHGRLWMSAHRAGRPG
jgi:predicted NBD/HSP70 family sugar kinase